MHERDVPTMDRRMPRLTKSRHTPLLILTSLLVLSGCAAPVAERIPPQAESSAEAVAGPPATRNPVVEVVPANLTPEERRIADWVDAHTDEAIELIRHTVEINSGSLNLTGVRDVGAVMRAEFDALGLVTEWIEMPPEMNRAGHLVATNWPAATPGLSVLLIGHLDTVFEKGDPFQHWLRDGDIAYGPGTEDMKGGNVVILYALKALHEVGALDDARVIAFYTGDEERPGEPLQVARKSLIEAGRRVDVALGFEASVRIDGVEYGTIARRSSTGWLLEAAGRPAHSSGIFGPEVGAGAIFEAARILDGFYDEVRGEQYLTFSAGIILGGTEVEYDSSEAAGTAFGKTNVVPERVVVDGGLRTISDEQRERAQAAMREVVARHLPHTSATITFREGYPAMPPTEGNRNLLSAYASINEALDAGRMKVLDPSKRGAADISFVAPYVDAALAGLGPHGGAGHTRDEFMDLSTLPLVIKRSAILIYRLTQGRVELE